MPSISMIEKVVQQVCAIDYLVSKYTFLLINQFIQRQIFLIDLKYLSNGDAEQQQRVYALLCMLLAEMPSYRAVFGLNNRISLVNRHLRFCPLQKNSEMCRVLVRIIHLTMAPTRHISELKYAPTYDTFPSFFVMDKTADAYSLQICDYLSQIQR